MKTAVITGASSGIGMEFARTFANMGYRLVLTARRQERLEKLADELNVESRIVVADLSKEEECERFLKEISDENVDVFINNAGFGTCGRFDETSLEKELNMIDLNVKAMHILFKGMLTKMKAQSNHEATEVNDSNGMEMAGNKTTMTDNHNKITMNDKHKKTGGIILNVASSAGLLPAGPYMATYYATKSYVVSVTKAVAQELKEEKSGIHVCALCPGPVDTEFNDNADVIFALKGISVKKCVQEAVKGMKNKKIIIIPSMKMKLAIACQRIAPGPILMKIVARQQKKKTQ